MDVSAFRFAIETLEKDRWSVLCLMDDDLESARMAWTLVEMLPGDGVRIALIDPHLADKPERILWEHLKFTEPEPERPEPELAFPSPIRSSRSTTATRPTRRVHSALGRNWNSTNRIPLVRPNSSTSRRRSAPQHPASPLPDGFGLPLAT